MIFIKFRPFDYVIIPERKEGTEVREINFIFQLVIDYKFTNTRNLYLYMCRLGLHKKARGSV
jgi:hypothetical protein